MYEEDQPARFVVVRIAGDGAVVGFRWCGGRGRTWSKEGNELLTRIIVSVNNFCEIDLLL